MDYCYRVLKIVYEIVKHDPHPTSYLCKPREIILRIHEDWSFIYEQLQLLQVNGFVECRQMDTLVISITQNGIEKLRAGTIVP